MAVVQKGLARTLEADIPERASVDRERWRADNRGGVVGVSGVRVTASAPRYRNDTECLGHSQIVLPPGEPMDMSPGVSHYPTRLRRELGVGW
jgi:hypothetical protein